MRTLLGTAAALLFATPALGQTCWRPYVPYRTPFYYGCGYGRYNDNAVAIAGIAAAARVVETAMITQARPRPVVVERPVTFRPASAPVAAQAIPFGFAASDGSLRSPWSAFSMPPKAWGPGRIYFDPFTGRSFLAPGNG